MIMEIQKRRFIDYLRLCLQAVVTGGLIGIVVGLYQLGIQKVGAWSAWMYSSRNAWIICLMVVLIAGLAVLNDLILRFNPSLDGSGIPLMELGIRHRRPIDWKREILLMIANSYISTFAGFPLGSEGPSVVIAGKLGKMTRDITSVGDDDQIAMACGTGFGCAFLSPLAGLCYIFEESLHKFHPELILRSALMILSAFCTTSFINHHHLLEVKDIVLPNVSQYYIFLLLIVFNAGFGMAFVKALVGLKKLLQKKGNTKVLKWRGYAFFAVVMVLNFVCLSYMGSGSSTVASISATDSLWVLGGIFLLRFCLTVLTGSGKVTGGLVVPMMTLGAILGEISVGICHALFGLDIAIAPVIVLVSMCMMFGVVTKTPFTSVALIYSALAYSSGDYLHALILLPVSIVSVFLAFYISKWCRVDCLYEQLMEVALSGDRKPDVEASPDRAA